MSRTTFAAWIAAALLLAGSASCSAAGPAKLRRPERPILEPTHPIELEFHGLKGTTATAIVFEPSDAEALERNLLRLHGYVRQLELAPFWEGPPPPRWTTVRRAQ